MKGKEGSRVWLSGYGFREVALMRTSEARKGSGFTTRREGKHGIVKLQSTKTLTRIPRMGQISGVVSVDLFSVYGAYNQLKMATCN